MKKVKSASQVQSRSARARGAFLKDFVLPVIAIIVGTIAYDHVKTILDPLKPHAAHKATSVWIPFDLSLLGVRDAEQVREHLSQLGRQLCDWRDGSGTKLILRQGQSCASAIINFLKPSNPSGPTWEAFESIDRGPFKISPIQIEMEVHVTNDGQSGGTIMRNAEIVNRQGKDELLTLQSDSEYALGAKNSGGQADPVYADLMADTGSWNKIKNDPKSYKIV